jgi:hypothetical protein
VKRLTREHRVGLGVVDGNALGRTGAHLGAGNALGENLPQLVERLDRDYVVVAIGQYASELSSPGTEVEDGGIRGDLQEVEDARRPAGTAAVVLRGGSVEAARLLGQPTPASRNARFSFNISRAITRR